MATQDASSAPSEYRTPSGWRLKVCSDPTSEELPSSKVHIQKGNTKSQEMSIVAKNLSPSPVTPMTYSFMGYTCLIKG